MPIRTLERAGLTTLVPNQLVPQPTFGLDQPGRNGAFRRPEGGGDLPVGIAVVVAENDQGGVRRSKASEGIGERDGARRVVAVHFGRTRSPEQLADAAEALPPSMGNRDVQRDAVDPGLGRDLRLPATPRAVGAKERLLGAVLRRGAITEHPREHEEDPVVAVAEQPVEVLPDPRSVGRALALHTTMYRLATHSGKAGLPSQGHWRRGVRKPQS